MTAGQPPLWDGTPPHCDTPEDAAAKRQMIARTHPDRLAARAHIHGPDWEALPLALWAPWWRRRTRHGDSIPALDALTRHCAVVDGWRRGTLTLDDAAVMVAELDPAHPDHPCRG